MTKRIAVCGKGGVGKTTIVCGILNFLLEQKSTPILLVDADPNSNLAENLGLTYSTTIADIREELRESKWQNLFMSKTDYINIRLQEAVVEQDGFDFIVMGRPEGKECYCFINELLRNFLSNLSKNYKYVIVDTEAGMEHFSRRTTDNIDTLIIVTTPTKVSIQTAKKIFELVKKLKLRIFNVHFLLNLAEINSNNLKDYLDIKFDGIIHKDEIIYYYSEKGVPLLDNIKNSKFYEELKEFIEHILN